MANKKTIKKTIKKSSTARSTKPAAKSVTRKAATTRKSVATTCSADKCVVKRAGILEPFDERKVYGSVYAACYTVLQNHRACEAVAEKVTKKVVSQLRTKKTISSKDIMKLAAKFLREENRDMAFMYESHMDIS